MDTAHLEQEEGFDWLDSECPEHVADIDWPQCHLTLGEGIDCLDFEHHLAQDNEASSLNSEGFLYHQNWGVNVDWRE